MKLQSQNCHVLNIGGSLVSLLTKNESQVILLQPNTVQDSNR